MRNLRNQVRRERRLALLHKVQSACAQVAGMEMIPANKIDEIMKGIFGVQSACLFRLQSKINHDCDPNCHVVCSFPCSNIDVVAKRSIARGEELSISYVDPSRAASERKRSIANMHGFTCTCRRCEVNARWCRNTREWIQAHPLPPSPDTSHKMDHDTCTSCTSFDGEEEALDDFFDAFA
uniref:SET domain-containing protein n=2 Tax=Guillardia theta TaxID=55529 RepID=A0A7S4P9Q4_GUITH|mmetsp:Transcript_46370/g.145481  ORF Transcript_46370/g.145481 Transcript_46370/m.145481 type:complete len:180 (+) Transcript_46370:60-599(+)